MAQELIKTKLHEFCSNSKYLLLFVLNITKLKTKMFCFDIHMSNYNQVILSLLEQMLELT